MERSKAVGQGSVSVGQAFAAVGIIVALAITVPVIGILMVPGVLLATWIRALVEDASAGRPSPRAPAGARIVVRRALRA
ncbi:MAG TPA: hypothetical protein VM753_23630 [Anaeromyxobacter sp.]|jgi:hypothetical protein|nr:hypothetical protein [Anaeromyxobacter sp.]